MSSKYIATQVFERHSANFRVFVKDAVTNSIVSPFHDISLWHDKAAGIANMLVEIPRFTNAKLEVILKNSM